jgi:hypothetical protein
MTLNTLNKIRDISAMLTEKWLAEVYVSSVNFKSKQSVPKQKGKKKPNFDAPIKNMKVDDEE